MSADWTGVASAVVDGVGAGAAGESGWMTCGMTANNAVIAVRTAAMRAGADDRSLTVRTAVAAMIATIMTAAVRKSIPSVPSEVVQR